MRISQWAHFLNVAKWFRKYLAFSAQKRGLFSGDLRGTDISQTAPKRRLFCSFLGINTHNFVKNDPDFENKGLFDAKFY